MTLFDLVVVFNVFDVLSDKYVMFDLDLLFDFGVLCDLCVPCDLAVLFDLVPECPAELVIVHVDLILPVPPSPGHLIRFY